ncbi:single-stranded DNA-binding protein [Breznakia pachnodae]|uniref:Single-stranded DNA-binding protein n=1 Tax=Breznakia pachnodae TaxID=265178 RepID=A0ABU0E305_9FIRM|nr:single-stranded DNA-binding protein [Breznakia pachnodae]MDQ0361129.1 single-strand DNA-binding protein [Breznakia pachnodae]
MNKVLLTGRITKDLELRKTQSGTSVIRFTLAVNRRFKQEGQPDADFISCTAWGKTAETMGQYLHKGSLIGVEGRITTGTYQDKDGRTVYTTDVTIENFDFLESRSTAGAQTQSYTPQYAPQDQVQNSGYTQDQSSSVADDFANDTLDIASDDLPF